MTKNLKELKESCRQQSEELQDLLIQRDKLKEENVMNGNLDDTLVNCSAQEKPATAAQTNARAAKKRGTKDEGDQEFEDEALQVEDLEPTGVAAAKVSLAFHSVFFNSGNGHPNRPANSHSGRDENAAAKSRLFLFIYLFFFLSRPVYLLPDLYLRAGYL